MPPGDAPKTDEGAAPPPARDVAATRPARPARPRRSRARVAVTRTPPRGTQEVARDLLQLVLTTPTVEAYLDELVVLAGGVSPVVAGCGVTMRRGPQVLSTAVSNSLAADVDEVQHGLGEGPGLTAMETAQVVSVEDLAAERRFGRYPAHARERGVLSSFHVPLTVGGTAVGALNAYARQPHSFTRVVREGLTGFVAQAEVALALTLRAASEVDVAEQLQTALHTRSVIDQALGILMAQQGCDADRAFASLRALARTQERSIGEVAAELVTTTTGSHPRAARSRA